MSEFMILVGRIGFVVLLWLFVLLCANVIRTDIFGRTVPSDPRPVLDERRAKPAKKRTKSKKNDGEPRALMVAEGRQMGQEIDLSRDVMIGRSADCQFVIDDDYASNHHAVVRRHPSGGFYVEDQGSTNGTFINETRLTQATSMGIGDELRIGRTVMKMVR